MMIMVMMFMTLLIMMIMVHGSPHVTYDNADTNGVGGDDHDDGRIRHVCCTYLRQFKRIKVHLGIILTKY